jgi:hypothetical protein
MFQKSAEISQLRAGWQGCFDGKTPLADDANRCFALGG